MSLAPNPQGICTVCAKPFLRLNSLQVVCGVNCARKVPVITRKAKAEAARAERAKDRAARERLKTRKELTAEAQKAFNDFIRLRDHGKPCICCGAAMNWSSDRPGGEIDAGHYLSVGSAPHMRFVEANVHAQRKSCNKPGGAKRHAFRAGMIERIGLAAVLVLEADQSARKYGADDLRAIRDEYKARAKALRAEAIEEGAC